MTEKINELITLTAGNFEENTQQYIRQLRADLDGTGEDTPEALAAIDLFRDKLLASKAARDTAFAKVYAETFTEEEVDQLLAFYKSEQCKTVEKFAAMCQGPLSVAFRDWANETLKAVPALQEILNNLATKWLQNNVDFPVDNAPAEQPLPEYTGPSAA